MRVGQQLKQPNPVESSESQPLHRFYTIRVPVDLTVDIRSIHFPETRSNSSQCEPTPPQSTPWTQRVHNRPDEFCRQSNKFSISRHNPNWQSVREMSIEFARFLQILNSFACWLVGGASDGCVNSGGAFESGGGEQARRRARSSGWVHGLWKAEVGANCHNENELIELHCIMERNRDPEPHVKEGPRFPQSMRAKQSIWALLS